MGASIATGIGGLKSFQDCYDTLMERGPDRVNPFAIPCIIPNMGAGWVSMELGHARAALLGVHSLRGVEHGDRGGLDDIRLGRAEVMFCGGTEGRDQRGRYRRVRRDARALAAERRPGAGEPPVRRGARRVRHGRGGRDCRARGARACACTRREDLRRAAGYGVSSDAKHVTEPDPTGENPARAMKMAFADAGIDPDEIDYINAHGTSTPLGDAARDAGDQARARRGERARRRRSRRRRARRATASVRRVRSRRSSRRSRSATASCRRRSTTRTRIQSATSTTSRTSHATPTCACRVSNSFGFGGHNASIVFKRARGLSSAGWRVIAGRRSTVTAR